MTKVFSNSISNYEFIIFNGFFLLMQSDMLLPLEGNFTEILGPLD